MATERPQKDEAVLERSLYAKAVPLVTRSVPINGPELDNSVSAGHWIRGFSNHHRFLEGHIYALSTPTPNINIILRLMTDVKNTRVLLRWFDNAASKGRLVTNNAAELSSTRKRMRSEVELPSDGHTLTPQKENSDGMGAVDKNAFTARDLCVNSLTEAIGLLIRARAGKLRHIPANMMTEKVSKELDDVLKTEDEDTIAAFLGEIRSMN